MRAGAVGRLGEGNLACLVCRGPFAAEGPEAQPRQSVLAFASDEEVGEEIDIFEHDAVAMGHELGPVLAAGRGDGCGDEAEVAALVVGPNEEEAVAMIDGVFMLVFACGDQRELAGGIVGGEDVALAGDVAGGFENDVFAVAGAACAEVEALVVVLIDEHVGGVIGAEDVAVELVLALLFFVFDRVEQGSVIRGPGDGADALDGTEQVLAGVQVFDVQRVLTEAGGVSGVGEEAAVV